MREIKFRAWNTRYSFMMSKEITVCNSVVVDYVPIGYCEDETTDDDLIILQYTGLKDKNGVEIYEGDVVSIMDCEPSLYKIVWVDDMFRFDVEYIGTDLTNWQDESMGEFSSEDFEVIGNIYENSDLL